MNEEGWGPEYAAFQTKKITYLTYGRHAVSSFLINDYENFCKEIFHVHGIYPFKLKENSLYVYFG